MSRPPNLESLMSLQDTIVWAANAYGIGSTLVGATAFIGFDEQKDHFDNYFFCDGVADDVETQAAVDYVEALGGGRVCVDKGLYYYADTVDVKHTYIHGSGMTWHGQNRGTCIGTVADIAGKPVFSFDEAERIHFAGIYDLTIYNQHGLDSIYIKSLADAHFERLYLNQGGQHGISLEGTEFDMWNLWIEDCLFENLTNHGIRIDQADHDIVKTHILNNYFFNNELGINIQQFLEEGGTAEYIDIIGNHFFTMAKNCIQLWKNCYNIKIVNNSIFRPSDETNDTSNGIRVGDGDAAGDKCQWIEIRGNRIDGDNRAKYGVSLEDSTDRILVLGNSINQCVTATYNAEVGVTNVLKDNNIEV